MATSTLTGTQCLPFCSGRFDPASNTARIAFRTSGAGMRFKVTGTDCTLTGNWSGSLQPFLLFIDGVAQATPTASAGVITLFTGLSDVQRTVELRLQASYAGTGNYLNASTTALTVTGAAPAAVADTTWGPQRAVHCGYLTAATLLCDTVGILVGPPYGTTVYPNAPGTGTPGVNNAGVRFKARADRIYVQTVTNSRIVNLYKDGVFVASITPTITTGGVYQWFEIANSLDDGNEHEWEVTAGGSGGNAQTLDMVMIGGANAAFSTSAPADRQCIMALGDSLTVAVSGGGTGDTGGNATYAYGAALGRLMGRDAILVGRSGSLTLVGAQQVASDLRVVMAAAGKPPSHLVILYGRNNSDTSTTQADYTTMLQQALAVPQFTGKIVVLTVPLVGSYAGPGALVNTGIRNAVAAVNSPRVVVVEAATLTTLPVGSDGTHYQITGHSQLAQFILDSGAMADLSTGYPGADDVRSGTTYGPTGSDFTGTCAVPTAAQVLTGVGVDATTGTVVLPAVGSVLTGVSFGPSSGSTGTLTLPSAGNVLSGSGAYGNPGSAVTPTLTLPTAAQVLTGVTFGAGGTGSTGAVTLPNANTVKSGTTFGPSLGTTGTYTVTLPTAAQVLSGVSFGSPQASLTGTVTLPDVGDVRSGTQYGAGGNQFTGTLAGGGGDYPTPEEIAAAVLAAASAAPIAADTKKINGVVLTGGGTSDDPMEPAT